IGLAEDEYDGPAIDEYRSPATEEEYDGTSEAEYDSGAAEAEYDPAPAEDGGGTKIDFSTE
ncbi:hypothetical protein LTR73_009378, partial [Friedmanniomyces endolithicus]